MRMCKMSALVTCLLLAGCTGLNSESHFKCKAPEGIGCSSLSGTYANAVANNLPGEPIAKSATYGQPEEERRITGSAPSSGMPVLSEPIVLRVWVAPWEDGRKVLHDQTYLYAVVDPGHWQIEHNKRRLRDQYRILAPAKREQPKEPTTEQQPFMPPTSNQLQPKGSN